MLLYAQRLTPTLADHHLERPAALNKTFPSLLPLLPSVQFSLLTSVKGSKEFGVGSAGHGKAGAHRESWRVERLREMEHCFPDMVFRPSREAAPEA
jgi:hypothetical protein